MSGVDYAKFAARLLGTYHNYLDRDVVGAERSHHRTGCLAKDAMVDQPYLAHVRRAVSVGACLDRRLLNDDPHCYRTTACK